MSKRRQWDGPNWARQLEREMKADNELLTSAKKRCSGRLKAIKAAKASAKTQSEKEMRDLMKSNGAVIWNKPVGLGVCPIGSYSIDLDASEEQLRAFMKFTGASDKFFSC